MVINSTLSLTQDKRTLISWQLLADEGFSLSINGAIKTK